MLCSTMVFLITPIILDLSANLSLSYITRANGGRNTTHGTAQASEKGEKATNNTEQSGEQ